MTGWRYVCASAIGTSHVTLDKPCQDHARCEILEGGVENAIVGVVSDGAGSAELSQFGSEIACATIIDAIHAHLTSKMVVDITKEDAAAWVNQAREAITARADADGRKSRDYACTLLAGVVSESHAVFLQIGDGAIVVANGTPNDWSWIFWPQKGEFANMTNFITGNNALDCLEFCSTEASPIEFSMFTDGIESLVLDYQTKAVFHPFFDTMFPAVRSLLPHDDNAKLCAGLSQYLLSPVVCNRTDDDKSLIMATRMDAIFTDSSD